MSDTFTTWLQKRLVQHGFTCLVDGIPGTMTRRAINNFQKARGLPATGNADVATVAALRLQKSGEDSGPANITMRPLWLTELERRKGLNEVRDNTVLSKWLKSDGWFLGNPRVLPWCGDAIQTTIALTLPNEPQIANPGLARNWLKFGKTTKPRLGAIMVFWRGSKTSGSGHVALYLGEDDTHFHVIGGNQSDSISVTRIAKSRLLGARWPVTDDVDTFAITMKANGAISTNEA